MKGILFLDKPWLLGAGVGGCVLAVTFTLAICAEIAVSERKLRHTVSAYELDIECAILDEDWLRVRHIIDAVYFSELSFVRIRAPDYVYTYPFSLQPPVCGQPITVYDVKRYGTPVARLEACVDTRQVILNLLCAKSVVAWAVLASLVCGSASAWPLWLHRRALARLTSILSRWARGERASVCITAGDSVADGLVTLVAEGVQRQEALTKRVEIAKATEELGAIASQVAHDIRSPLSALDAVWASGDWNDDETRTLARASILRIKDIANDLLAKRRSVGAVASARQPATLQESAYCATTCLYSLVDEIGREQRARLKDNDDVGVVIEHPYGALHVRADPARLLRAISNLANNAVESLQGGGQVTLAAGICDRYAQIRVSDTGCGMSSELLSCVLAGGYTSKKKDGNGMGLVAARQVVLAYGGDFDVRSALGIGTVITITFPAVARYLLPKQPASVRHQPYLGDKYGQGSPHDSPL